MNGPSYPTIHSPLSEPMSMASGATGSRLYSLAIGIFHHQLPRQAAQRAGNPLGHPRQSTSLMSPICTTSSGPWTTSKTRALPLVRALASEEDIVELTGINALIHEQNPNRRSKVRYVSRAQDFMISWQLKVSDLSRGTSARGVVVRVPWL